MQGSNTSLCRRRLALFLLCAAALGAGPANAEPARPRLVVIGATAKSSTEIIRQALAAGYAVVGVARRPADVTLRDPQLTVLKGDVYDQGSLAAAMTGSEVVISMVGPRLDPMDMTPTPASFDLFTTGTANIIAAMKARGNRRLLVASSLGVEDEHPAKKPADPKDMRMNWLWKTRHLYGNMRAMEELVRNSGLEYVIFRPPFLVEEPARQDYRLSVNVNSPKGSMMTYADFGAFVLAQARSNHYLGAAVGLHTDRELRFGENVDFDKLAIEAREKAQRAGDIPGTGATP